MFDNIMERLRTRVIKQLERGQRRLLEIDVQGGLR